VLEEIIDADERKELEAMRIVARSVAALDREEAIEAGDGTEMDSDEDEFEDLDVEETTMNEGDIGGERGDEAERVVSSDSDSDADADIVAPDPMSSNEVGGPNLTSETCLANRISILRASRCSHQAPVIARQLGVELTAVPALLVKDKLANSKLMGSLKVTFNGTCIQGKCEFHRGCKALLSIKPRASLFLPEVEADMLAWVVAGSTVDYDAHQALLTKVKQVYYGVKTRS
jgi:hypothetical protein